MTTRRLAAILAADVAGYSAAMERDEEGTAAAVRSLRREVIEPKLTEHQGRLIKTTGDGFLAEFASPIAALKCALAIQQRPAESDGLRLRIGLNLGDVIIEEGGDLLGEGVNVAARLEGLAEPGGILISSKIHSEVEGKVQAAFEDRGEQQVKNISRPVRIYAVALSASLAKPAVASQSEAGNPLPLPDKPSIAVLPFQNMSGDPEQEYFADGMVEDIITALSRFKSLFVIARNSSFTYKGRAVDIKQVGRELGVGYVLEGSVRRAGGRLRITTQLIEAMTGNHVWADRFDGELEDVFDLQDDVTQKVVGTIGTQIEQIETARAKSKLSFGAYDLVLRGHDMLRMVLRGACSADDGFSRALQLYGDAIKLYPTYALALGSAAHVHHLLAATGSREYDRESTAEALRLARLAIEHGGSDPEAMVRAGAAVGLFESFEAAVEIYDRALVLNQNLAMAWSMSGWANAILGRCDRAIECTQTALRLSPLDRARSNKMAAVSLALFLKEQFEDAYSWAERAAVERPDEHVVLRALATSAAMTDRQARATQALDKLAELYPAHLERFLRVLRRPQDAELMRTALVRAGYRQ